MRAAPRESTRAKNATESVSEFGHALPKTTISYDAVRGK